MKQNNIVIAPCIPDDGGDIELMYEMWMKQYNGDKDAFFEFLTTPSLERDVFTTAFLPVFVVGPRGEITKIVQ